MLLSFCAKTALAAQKQDLHDGTIIPEIAAVAYSGGEQLRYDVSWSGGIKIGEIAFDILKDTTCEQCYNIYSLISTTGGIIHRLYPVEDRQVTKVTGDQRLPWYSETWQKQGRDYRAHKEVIFDQNAYTVTKKKEGDKRQGFYHLDGVVHNEFSAFFASRVMDLHPGNAFTVPTFGDDARNEVVVDTFDEEILKKTVLGDVKTLKVSPILTFSGLYDKQGDTIVWYTDDECRIPVRIQSRLVIGSLTAVLREYRNPRCNKYTTAASANGAPDLVGNGSSQRKKMKELEK